MLQDESMSGHCRQVGYFHSAYNSNLLQSISASFLHNLHNVCIKNDTTEATRWLTDPRNWHISLAYRSSCKAPLRQAGPVYDRNRHSSVAFQCLHSKSERGFLLKSHSMWECIAWSMLDIEVRWLCDILVQWGPWIHKWSNLCTTPKRLRHWVAFYVLMCH